MEFAEMAFYQTLLLVLVIAFAFICYMAWDQHQYIAALNRHITLIDAMRSALAEAHVSAQAEIRALESKLLEREVQS